MKRKPLTGVLMRMTPWKRTDDTTRLVFARLRRSIYVLMLSPILLPIFSEVVFTLLDAVLLAMLPVCDAQTTTIFIGEKKKQEEN